MTNPKPEPHHVEGGGPVGCGCGALLGTGIGIAFLLKFGAWGVAIAVAIGALCGLFGWKFGDGFFEKALSGNPDGKPGRYWWFR